MREGMFNGLMSGIFGSCVGGGGLVLIPLWQRAGIDKDVISSSTAPLMFFSASTSFIMSALSGGYDSILKILLYFALGFGASYIIKSMFLVSLG